MLALTEVPSWGSLESTTCLGLEPLRINLVGLQMRLNKGSGGGNGPARHPAANSRAQLAQALLGGLLGCGGQKPWAPGAHPCSERLSAPFDRVQHCVDQDFVRVPLEEVAPVLSVIVVDWRAGALARMGGAGPRRSGERAFRCGRTRTR